MRCPSCGTENAPDSRFCGVCGAKQAPPGRLAATAKIPDDAPFPQPAQKPQAQQGYQQGPASIPPQPNPYAATGPASIPPSSGPASIPPTSKGPASIPPHMYQRAATPAPVDSQRVTPVPPELRSQDPNFVPQTSQRAPVRVPSPAPAGSMAGDSFVVPPQRPLGLIAIVLVIDLALAGSGAVMLSKGLAKKKPADTAAPKAPAMQQRSEAAPPPAPAPTPAPSPSPTEAVQAAAPPPPPAVTPPITAAAAPVIEAKPDKTQTRDKDKKTKGSKTTSSGPVTSPSGPVTDPGHVDNNAAGPPPPAGFDLKGEANKLASSSNDLFARCLGAAGTVHGTINVAYQVNPDGSVSHPFAVENSTGNEQLGTCLADVINTWRFPVHPGEAQNAVRPFKY